MLTSAVILAIVQFSAASEPLLDAAALIKPSPNGTPFTPEEPSTLALALIGIAIIGAYVAFQRRWRPQREPRQIFVPTAHADVARIETPTRGAA